MCFATTNQTLWQNGALWYYQDHLQRAATCQPETITWILSVWVTLLKVYLTSGKQNRDQHSLNLECSQTSALSMLSLKGILGQIEKWDIEGTLNKSMRCSMWVYVCAAICRCDLMRSLIFFLGWQQICTHLTLHTPTHTNLPSIYRLSVKQDAKNKRMNFLP